MKIGIFTHYHGSTNYGGVLQAYALVKTLRDMGHEAEQVCFPLKTRSALGECSVQPSGQSAKPEQTPAARKRSVIRYLKRIVSAPFEQRRKKRDERNERDRLAMINRCFFVPRCRAFKAFRDSIPHSEKEYAPNCAFMLNGSYDGFVTGSDQVWNFKWHSPLFFLEFADPDKKKIAYAVSAGTSSFDAVQKEYLKRVLPKLDAISVRENDLTEIYQKTAGVESEAVLDPVLLLTREEWDIIASERLVSDAYLFCFFYQPVEEPYRLAEKYAKLHRLKIVTVPYALMQAQMKIDDDFGDIRLGDASPADFLSLIKYADCVFTDSFHCNAFSALYERPFFVFGRDGMEEMNSRIVSLTEMFGCENRFCNTPEKRTVEYLEHQKSVCCSFARFEEQKEKSLRFLKDNLK